MLWVQEDIDEKVLLWLFLTCVMARDAAMGNLTYTAIPLGLLGLPRSSLRGRRLKRKGKGVLGARETRDAATQVRVRHLTRPYKSHVTVFSWVFSSRLQDRLVVNHSYVQICNPAKPAYFNSFTGTAEKFRISILEQ